MSSLIDYCVCGHDTPAHTKGILNPTGYCVWEDCSCTGFYKLLSGALNPERPGLCPDTPEGKIAPPEPAQEQPGRFTTEGPVEIPEDNIPGRFVDEVLMRGDKKLLFDFLHEHLEPGRSLLITVCDDRGVNVHLWRVKTGGS